MRHLFTTLLLVLAGSAVFPQLSDREIMDRKLGRVKKDTSYVYGIPYAKGSRYLFVQGANSSMSHQDELSFDFKMKPGSKVCAARDGKVIATRADSDKGGLKNEFLSEGNYIMIGHSDGTVAHYWHLQQHGVLVKNGDLVKQGQLIGYSGNTGYSAFPHLHFQVIDSGGKQVLPRFLTKKGIIYLRPGHWYKSVNY
jgi:Peptidase family M23